MPEPYPGMPEPYRREESIGQICMNHVHPVRIRYSSGMPEPYRRGYKTHALELRGLIHATGMPETYRREATSTRLPATHA